MNIPTRICPLCSKKLLVGDEDSIHTFYCSEFYLRHAAFDWKNFQIWNTHQQAYTGGKIREPHYSVTIEDGIWTQSTLIPPYWVISSTETNKSKIYKYKNAITTPGDEYLLMEIPILSPSDYIPDNFARKIKNLVIFS